MSNTNNFLQFCPTDTGTNLLTESEYTASADRTSGNKPGVASSKLNNRALRQANYITSQVAQFISDTCAVDVLDDATPAKLLGQIQGALSFISPFVQSFPASATYNRVYAFIIASGSATVAATYTNNGHTYTVAKTVATGFLVYMKGSAAPTTSGTLTKASGTGDTTLTFYAVRIPIALAVKIVGAGGGGGSADSTVVAAGDGGDSTFASTLLVGGGGKKGAFASKGGAAGTASIDATVQGQSFSGNPGAPAQGATGNNGGGTGGPSYFGGSGAAGYGNAGSAAGSNAATNSGAGGGGGGGNNDQTGSGGGSGGYAEGLIQGPAITYAIVIGAKGAGGTGAGGAGGDGADGYAETMDIYQ